MAVQTLTGSHLLCSFRTAGKARILDRVREVLALHKDKYCFPIKWVVCCCHAPCAIFSSVLRRSPMLVKMGFTSTPNDMHRVASPLVHIGSV